MAQLISSGSRQADGLKAFIEQSHADECRTPGRPFLWRRDIDTHTAYFIQPDCKLWSCEPCAARRAAHWAYTINFGTGALRDAGAELSLVTLTSHRRVRTVAGGIFVWRDAWPRIAERMRRKQPGVQFVYTAEHRRSEHFHVHLVTTAEMKTRWYKDTSAQTGMGYESKARRLASGEYPGGYISKYITKSLDVKGWPRYWRRVNKSRKWPIPPTPEQLYTWTYIGSSVAVVRLAMASLMRDGYRISHDLKLPDTSQLEVT